MVARPQRIPTGDVQIDRAVDAVRLPLAELVGVPVLGGVLLTDIDLPDGVTVRVNHGLGRKWRGWIIASMRGASTSGRIQDADADDNARQLWLKADGYGATVTVSAWVF